MWHSFVCNPFNLVGRMVEFEVMDYGMKPGSIRHGRFVRMRPDLDSSDTANAFSEEPQ